MIEQEEVKQETVSVVEEVSIELKNIIETLIFASDEPISTKMIRAIIEDANKERSADEQLSVNAEIIRKAIAELNRGYEKSGTGFKIIELAAAFTYATKEQFAAWVGRLQKEKARRKLSSTAVETLAIIAYKQPITKVEVEFIRGVNVDYIMKTLLEKNLIHITGRQNSPGRPLLYGTTDEFLIHFGLNDLSDLPKPREIEELIGETEAEVDRRLLAEQHALEFKEELEEKLEGHEGTKQQHTKQTKQPRVKVSVPQEVKDERVVQKTEEEKTGEAPVPTTVESIVPEQQKEISIEHTAEEVIEETAQEQSTTEEEIVQNVESATVELVENEIAQQLEEQTTKIFGERGLEGEPQSNHEEIEQKEIHSQSGKEESGWSKWKSKVKTFFQKLFA